MTTTTTTQVPIGLWTEADIESQSTDHAHEGTHALLDVQAEDERNEVSIHLHINDRGSFCSYTLDREAALGLALRIIQAAGVE